MSTKIRILSLLTPLAFLCVQFVYSQDEKPVIKADVMVNAVDPTYSALRSLSTAPDSFSGDYATVNNLVLKKDAGIFTLSSGSVYFIKPVDGRTTGAVFIGSGEFSLVPPVEVEKKHLAIFTDAPEVKEGFSQLIMFFTDDTLDEIKRAGAQMGKNGPEAARARDLFRDKENTLRKQFHYNMTSRILSDVYSEDRKGFFGAFIDGNRFGKLFYGIDPLGHEEVYPEQVELMSYGETTGGIWTAFHMAAEYANGTATSWQDRRIYDIRNHNINTTVDGTRLIVKDEITIEMREAKARFLPFDLFRTLRVKSVKDESGSELLFIQEKKDEDADFGVILPAAREIAKPFKITVEYDGIEALREAGTGNFILIPRSTWYPNNPNSAFGDRATFEITFRYPKKYLMIGVGSRVGEETIDGNQKVAKWSSNGVELAVAGFNYGDFKMKELKDESTGLALEVYTNNELPAEMRELQLQIDRFESQGGRTNTTLGSLNTASMASTVLNEAQNSVRIYNGFFGKLPQGRLAMTQQPAGNFGQAWPTLVFMPYTAFFGETHRVQLFGIKGGTDGFWREVAAHEVAHQWWGHIVGWTSYRDQWMSEGFSEFSTSLFIQYVKKDPGKFDEFWNEQRKLILEASPATNGRKPFKIGPVTQGYRLNSAKTGNVARAMIYPKGAFILHMLRMMMYDRKEGTGDARFQKMMKEFLAEHYNKDVSTNDFKLAVEKHMLPIMDVTRNGKMDWYFDNWVYGTDIPSYKLTYSVSSSGDGKSVLNATLVQSGVSDSFVNPIPVYVDFGKGWVYLGAGTIKGSGSLQLKDIPLPAPIKRITVAAMNDVLAEKIDVTKQ